jgi:hypothetical protein
MIIGERFSEINLETNGLALSLFAWFKKNSNRKR